jgi:DNA/RNA-binding domain of Phe-tRNA-synthetase-like protein
MLTIDPHPLLDLQTIVAEFPQPLERVSPSPALLELLALDAQAPMSSSDEIRAAVRDLLRHGAFKPTGRSKPASEYLLRAAGDGTLGSINVAVDICNAVSLHSGLPISVVDLDRIRQPLRVGIPQQGAAYVFNSAGQTIDVAGLVSLFDAAGPCAGPVKDSQRTKTGPQTRRTLTLIWGTSKLSGKAAQAQAWYCDLLVAEGCNVTTPTAKQN